MTFREGGKLIQDTNTKKITNEAQEFHLYPASASCSGLSGPTCENVCVHVNTCVCMCVCAHWIIESLSPVHAIYSLAHSCIYHIHSITYCSQG